MKKFRTPTKCQNGHFRWLYSTFEKGNVTHHWGPKDKNCKCPTHEAHEGFLACGEDQQYVGFNDKENKEIYESDIVVRACPCGDCNNFWTGLISFRDNVGQFVFRDFENQEDTPLVMYQPDDENQENGQPIELKVIGNLDENPDLAQKAKIL